MNMGYIRTTGDRSRRELYGYRLRHTLSNLLSLLESKEIQAF